MLDSDWSTCGSKTFFFKVIWKVRVNGNQEEMWRIYAHCLKECLDSLAKSAEVSERKYFVTEMSQNQKKLSKCHHFTTALSKRYGSGHRSLKRLSNASIFSFYQENRHDRFPIESVMFSFWNEPEWNGIRPSTIIKQLRKLK